MTLDQCDFTDKKGHSIPRCLVNKNLDMHNRFICLCL